MAYLDEHPPARRQFRARGEKPSGLIVVHTAESILDAVGPDTGAEAVADFIRRRADPGSYHRIADSDSRVDLVRFSQAAYGDGTGSNEFAIHVSFALKAADWTRLTLDERRAFIKQGALAVAEAMTWLKVEHGIVVPLRRVSRADSEARKPGFISHGERDPGRRSDPGADFPWEMLFDEVEALVYPKPDPKEVNRAKIDQKLDEAIADVKGARNKAKTPIRPKVLAKVKSALKNLRDARRVNRK